ncbi:MAG: pyrophosphatase PpaX [Bacillota bacterium]
MTIQYILFDLDGTLLDTNELIIQSFQHTYKKHLKKEVPREYIIKTFGETLSTTLARECSHCLSEAVESYRAFQQVNFENYITIHTGVKEGLENLSRKGYRLAVVTSRLNASAIRGLQHFDIEKYFEVIIGADDTEEHKPSPVPALMALEKLEGSPEKAIMVGDSPFDIQCAQNAEMLSVAVSWSALPKNLYMQYGPDYVVDTMEELIALIDNIRDK